MERIVTTRRGEAWSYDVSTRSGHRFAVTPGSEAADDPGPAPMELMLASLATCSAATFALVFERMRLEVSAFEIGVDALRSAETPRIWTDIEVRYHLRSEARIERLERAVALTAKSCSVSVMLAKAARLSESLFVVRRVTESETIDVRHAVLRTGTPRSSVSVSGDDAAVWFGVDHAGSIEGCVGVFEEESPEGDSDFRLRAMATSEIIRGSGLGRMLVDELADHVVSVGGDSVWCSARTVAAGFYQNHGFEVTSDEFMVESIGPHVRMRRAL